MSDELGYYERELTRLRRDAAEFAEAHPKVAARLRLGGDAGDDPHVERLLQGFAYLTAGVRRTLDDGYADIAEALLGALHPHALAPVPPLAVAQFALGAAQNELATGLIIPRGAAVETEPVKGEPCRFRTAWAVPLLPIDVTAARVQAAPAPAPPLPKGRGAAAVARVRLAARAASLPLGKMAAPRLRFYLNAPAPVAGRLYEALLKDAVEVALGHGPADAGAAALGPGCVAAAGFGDDEALWPDAGAAGAGLRAMAQFLHFPRGALFVEVELPPRAWARLGAEAELFFYLKALAPELESAVDAGTFRLGCTPAVNLASRRAEPIRLTQETAAARAVPDARRPGAFEVHSIDAVTLVSAEGQSTPVPELGRAGAGLFWHATRRPSQSPGDRGTEVFITLADRGARPSLPDGATLHLDVTCTNRDLPARLPFGGGQPKLALASGGPVGRVEFLSAPTAAARPGLGAGALWRLVAAVNLNPLTVSGGAAGAEALRDLLAACAPAGGADAASTIAGVVAVENSRATAWAGGALCRGAEVTVTVDAAAFPGGPFAFLTALDRFLGQISTLNSFTRLVAKRAGREGVYHAWPARSGDRPLA